MDYHHRRDSLRCRIPKEALPKALGSAKSASWHLGKVNKGGLFSWLLVKSNREIFLTLTLFTNYLYNSKAIIFSLDP